MSLGILPRAHVQVLLWRYRPRSMAARWNGYVHIKFHQILPDGFSKEAVPIYTSLVVFEITHTSPAANNIYLFLGVNFFFYICIVIYIYVSVCMYVWTEVFNENQPSPALSFLTIMIYYTWGSQWNSSSYFLWYLSPYLRILCFYCYFFSFWLCHVACGLLVPWPRIEPWAMEVKS